MEDQLEYFKIANKLNEEHKEALRSYKLHFRGNMKSFSLISLCKYSPEKGEGGMETEDEGRNILKKVISPKYKWSSPGRSTREKELQAWIINSALNNKNNLPFGHNLKFVTSELVLSENGHKIVNDILAIDENDDLVIIELKSKRSKAELEIQIARFVKRIEECDSFFKELVELLMLRKWSGKSRGMVVWPYARNSSPSMWKHGIVEKCYREKEINNKMAIDYDAAGNIQFVEY